MLLLLNDQHPTKILKAAIASFWLLYKKGQDLNTTQGHAGRTKPEVLK